MIDIHSHVIPNVDDGPRDLEESINLIKQAMGIGIQTIVATPHFHPYKYPRNRKERVLKSVEELKVALKSHSLDNRINIIPGQEVYLYDGLIEGLDRGDILTINNNGRYLLIEFPMTFYPTYGYKVIERLMDRHITPIIAHPERHVFFREDPSLLKKYTDLGAIIQINSSSLQYKKNRKVHRFSKSLLDWDCMRVIASDAHNIDFRPFYAADVYKDKKKNENIHNYLQENARRIIDGELIPQSTCNNSREDRNQSLLDVIFNKINLFRRGK
ncbi:TPA: PHP domain-containing protein [Bacillus cereus]|nr:PHP domain-containing protein [Bacillus cereus]